MAAITMVIIWLAITSNQNFFFLVCVWEQHIWVLMTRFYNDIGFEIYKNLSTNSLVGGNVQSRIEERGRGEIQSYNV